MSGAELARKLSLPGVEHACDAIANAAEGA